MAKATNNTARVAINGDAARTEQAITAAESLTGTIDAARDAGNAIYANTFGADIDAPAVKLARAAAVEASGGTKSRGEARANVLAILDLVSDAPELTPAVFVAAARVRLDILATAKRERRETKKALADTLKNGALPIEDRVAAMTELDGMERADDALTLNKRMAAFRAAMIAALNAGATVEELVHELESFAASTPVDAALVTA